MHGNFYAEMVPSFDPLTTTISSTQVWVRLKNLPLHLWNLSSLKEIGDAIGVFHFQSPKTKDDIIPYICLDLCGDGFQQGFSSKTKFNQNRLLMSSKAQLR